MKSIVDSGSHDNHPKKDSPGWWVKWAAITGAFATPMSAIATVAIAFLYFSQIDTMKESSRISQMPILVVSVSDNPNSKFVYQPDTTEEGGERWLLPYWVINQSSNTAHRVTYFHALTFADTMSIPEETKFVTRFEEDIILPNDTINGGYDQILRQVVIDAQKAGKQYYRHFIVRYCDESGNTYVYHTVWSILKYAKGNPPQFNFVSRRRSIVN